MCKRKLWTNNLSLENHLMDEKGSSPDTANSVPSPPFLS
jgi:hypothetical protein